MNFQEILKKVTDEETKAALLAAYTKDNETAAHRATKTTKTQLEETQAQLKQYQEKEKAAKVASAQTVLGTLTEAQRTAVVSLVPAESEDLESAYTKKAEELGFSLTKSDEEQTDVKKTHLIKQTGVTQVDIEIDEDDKDEEEFSITSMYRL